MEMLYAPIVSSRPFVDDLTGETVGGIIVVRQDGYAVQAWSARRGGCLYAGEVEVRNVTTGASHSFDSTMDFSEATETKVAYLLSMIEKHRGKVG